MSDSAQALCRESEVLVDGATVRFEAELLSPRRFA